MSGTGKRAWRDNIVKLPLSPDAQAQYGADSVYVQTHPALIEVYEKHGGGAWEWVGKDIGVAMDPHGSNHWNDCAAPQDMMGPRRFRPTADPALEVVTWISPLTAQAATVHGGFTVDMKQLRPTDYHIPHYWNDQGNRICGVMSP